MNDKELNLKKKIIIKKTSTYTHAVYDVCDCDVCIQIIRPEYMPHFARYFQCHTNDAALFRSIVFMQTTNGTVY